MNLFEIQNNVVTFSPQALTLAPFKAIWDNDDTKDKSVAIKELSYIYYMTDDRSDYQYELDDTARSIAVLEIVELGTGWYQSTEVKEAMEYYSAMSETTSTKLLRSTRGIVQKMSLFLDTINPNERDKANKLIFPINQIISSVEKMPKLIKALNEIEKEVIKEKNINAQTGNRDVGVFDDDGI